MSQRQEAGAPGPAIILIDPQLGENIGMVARAMLNCGLADLRLVRPRDGWPSRQAESAASGAVDILARARLFETTGEAVADLHRLYAMTARPRGLTKPLASPRQVAAEIRAGAGAGRAAGVLLGPERSGLTNDDVALADVLVRVPLNPAFTSLNLAQAVLVLGYEWFLAGDAPRAAVAPPTGGERPATKPTGAERPATKAELMGFFVRLEAALDQAGFLLPVEKRPTMVRNLRTLFARGSPSEQEVRTLHGIVSALTARRRET